MVGQTMPAVKGRLSQEVLHAVETENLDVLQLWLDDPNTALEDTEVLYCMPHPLLRA
jgi:hypothetical protein